MNFEYTRPLKLFIGLMLVLVISSCTGETPLFEQLKADKIGVTFSNDITENDTMNIINYTNMYNGGGVAIADFDNDGLQDIYFTGAMVDNELYLNQGNFEFANVTSEANVAAAGRWSSGVAVVDINADELMDIYINATTNNDTEQRTNIFYINQGLNENNVPVFKDMALEYNLADTAHTTMATFFDYDNDEDLDLFLMVNQFNRHNSMNRANAKSIRDVSITRDRLFRNEGADSLGHPWFRDVSDEAGITVEGYGLGVNITDINKDGWKDILIANDFFTNDVLYINNGDGTFTNKSAEVFKHTAYAAMGNDVADLNNDGHPEVVVVDMRPEDNYRKKKMLEPNSYSAYLKDKRNNYDSQVVRNVLQVYQGKSPETGEPLYSGIEMYSGVAETDWSWAPLLVDFDNDGWRDMIITNGFPKDMTDNDLEKYFRLYPQYVSTQEVLEKIPSVKISNYAYRNKGNLKFEDVTEKWGMKIPSFSNGAAQVDLNNDGALDLVVNNINEPAFIFRNRLAELRPEKNNYLRVKLEGSGANTMGLGTLVEIKYGDGEKQFHEHTTYRGYVSSVEPIAHFGLGAHKAVDKLTVEWPDGSVQVLKNLTANQMLTVHQQNAVKVSGTEADTASRPRTVFRDITGELGIDYVHEEWDFNDFNIQPLLPHKLSQYGPGLAVGDVDGNGLSDMYISGAYKFEGTFFVQQEDGTFAKEDLLVGNDPGHREEELGSLFFDADGDGDDDLYIVSGGYEHAPGNKAYQDRLFINEGGRFKLVSDALPQFLSSGSSVRAADFDRDGDLDLFLGGRVQPYRYPEPADSYILKNVSKEGRVQFEIVNDEVAPVLNKIGMISDALWTDFNGDGWMDLIVAGEWASLKFLENDAGQLVDVTDRTGLANYKGWWNSLGAGDFDNDGDTDYIAGNHGTNSFFQASDQYPVNIYADDFDGNGVLDAVPAIYSKSNEGEKAEFPFHGRRNVSQQIPSIQKKFANHHAFATATMEEVISRFDKTVSLKYRANYMESSYIENKGDGTFDITPLPYEAQWAPIYGCIIQDVNNDGNPDVVMTGNDYGTELSAGRYDALNGLVLIGNGDGSFETLGLEESGFFVPGDAKALVLYRDVRNEPVIAASQNQGALKIFKKQEVNELISVQPDDAYALIHYKNGASRKEEFYYGSSFLSASGRFLTVTPNVVSIEITDFAGNARTVAVEELLAD